MEFIIPAFAAIGLIFVMGYNMGNYWGIKEGESLMRPKVVEYCIEKPKLCKEEYDHNKKVKEYKRPEIEETK